MMNNNNNNINPPPYSVGNSSEIRGSVDELLQKTLRLLSSSSSYTKPPTNPPSTSSSFNITCKSTPLNNTLNMMPTKGFLANNYALDESLLAFLEREGKQTSLSNPHGSVSLFHGRPTTTTTTTTSSSNTTQPILQPLTQRIIAQPQSKQESTSEDDWHRRITQLAMAVADEIEQNERNSKLPSSSLLLNNISNNQNSNSNNISNKTQSSNKCSSSSSMLTLLLKDSHNHEHDPIKDLLLSTLMMNSATTPLHPDLMSSDVALQQETREEWSSIGSSSSSLINKNSSSTMQTLDVFHTQHPELERIITDQPLTFEQAALLPPLNLKLRFTEEEMQGIDQMLTIPSSNTTISNNKNSKKTMEEWADQQYQSLLEHNQQHDHFFSLLMAQEGKDLDQACLQQNIPSNAHQTLPLVTCNSHHTTEEDVFDVSFNDMSEVLSSDENCHEDNSSVFPAMEEVFEFNTQEEEDEKHHSVPLLQHQTSSSTQATPQNCNHNAMTLNFIYEGTTGEVPITNTSICSSRNCPSMSQNKVKKKRKMQQQYAGRRNSTYSTDYSKDGMWHFHNYRDGKTLERSTMPVFLYFNPEGNKK